jgi:hypothetical protein
MMLHTTTTIYESPQRPGLLAWPSFNVSAINRAAVRHERERELAVDETLAESFPASDPPSWNAGIVRPAPASTSDGIAAAGVLDVSRPHDTERTLLQAFVSLAAAAGVSLVMPLAILLVGLPIALAARGLHELLLWLVPALG